MIVNESCIIVNFISVNAIPYLGMLFTKNSLENVSTYLKYPFSSDLLIMLSSPSYLVNMSYNVVVFEDTSEVELLPSTQVSFVAQAIV